MAVFVARGAGGGAFGFLDVAVAAGPAAVFAFAAVRGFGPAPRRLRDRFGRDGCGRVGAGLCGLVGFGLAFEFAGAVVGDGAAVLFGGKGWRSGSGFFFGGG